MTRRTSGWIFGLGGAGTLAVLGTALAHDPPGGPQGAIDGDRGTPIRLSGVAARAIGVQTAEVDFGRVERVVHVTGVVRPPVEAVRVVAAGVAGSLTKLEVRAGDRVKKGDVIGEMESVELTRMVNELHKTESEREHTEGEMAITRSNMQQMRNQVAGVEAQTRQLEEEANRLEQAGDPGAAAKRQAATQQRAQATTLNISLSQSSSTLDAMVQMQDIARRSIDAQREAIWIASGEPRVMGGKVTLRAPIDGVVTRRDAVLGQMLEAGREIVTVVDPSKVVVHAELPESLVPMVVGGNGGPMKARVRRPGRTDVVAEGTVMGVGPVVDTGRRAAELLVGVENPDGAAGLRDGMFVGVDVVVGAADAASPVVVPVQAVVQGAVPVVVVKERDGYVRREVVLGATDDRVVEVREGLVPGDVVVTRGAYLLAEVRGGPDAGSQGAGHAH